MYCPSFNVFGTFFPAWMLCALMGIAGSLLAFALFTVLKIDSHLKPRLLAYLSVALSVTFLSWIRWFGH